MVKAKKTTAASKQIVELVWQMTEPIAAKNGLELIDVEYVKEAGEWYLRIFIDREQEPVDHNCCQTISEALSALLDEADPITDSYYLEVSSPGIERPLKKDADFKRFIGNKVKILLYAPLEGKKEFVGELVGLVNNNIILTVDNQEVRIAKDAVAKAMLSVFS